MDIFSKIAAGEIPSYKCAESDKFYAFLDINPLVKGHTLVIPRREVDYIFDMEDDELDEYHVFAKKVAIAIKRAFPCIKSEKDMIFSNPKLKLSEEEFKEIADKIYSEFKKL